MTAPTSARLPFINIKSQHSLSPVPQRRLSCACPVHEGRIMRRLGVEQDTASRASCLASTRPGGFGSPPGPTMRLCHRLAGRGAGEGGEIRRMRASAPAACTRKRGPETQNRRDGAPEGVAAASALRRFGDTLRKQNSRCATRRSAAPHVLRGEDQKQNPAQSRAGLRRCGCLKFEYEGNNGIAVILRSALRRALALPARARLEGWATTMSSFEARRSCLAPQDDEPI